MPIIRDMIDTDVQAIVKLERETFTDAWTEKSVYDTFCQKQAFIVVAESDRKVVGYCMVYYVLDEGEVVRLAVNSNYRRQGVGRKLLNHAEQICKEKNITKLLLDVRVSNQTARTFYSNYGFGEDGIRKHFYEKPKEDAILMSKPVMAGNQDKE